MVKVNAKEMIEKIAADTTEADLYCWDQSGRFKTD